MSATVSTPTSSPAERVAEVTRNTNETQIRVRVNLDGSGRSHLSTGIGFFDHMLDQIARHGLIDLEIDAKGDLHIDGHHTVEDVGIALGQGIRQALGDRAGVARYGYAYAPLDEALSRVVVDCSGRPYLHFEAAMPEPQIGADFAASLVEEFWRALAMNAALTLHVDLLRARNAHHAAETIFKAGGLAIRAATRLTGDPTSVPSTKGVLA
jgi:imidazoleglycerol-phosphate dehydratase